MIKKDLKHWIVPILSLVIASGLVYHEASTIRLLSSYAFTEELILPAVAFFVLSVLYFAIYFIEFHIAVWKKIVFSAVGFFAFLIINALLLGFYQYSAALGVTIAILVVLSLFIFFGKFTKKGLIVSVAMLLVTVMLSYFFYYANVFALIERKNTVELTKYDDAELAPYAVAAEKIYVYEWDIVGCNSNYAFLQSLQGYLGRTSTEQIFMHYASTPSYEDETYYEPEPEPSEPSEPEEPHEKTEEELKEEARMQKYYETQSADALKNEEDQLATITKYYDVEIETITDIDDLLDKVGYKVKNYILCDAGYLESMTVGATLCYQMDAILLTERNIHYAEKYGWKQVFSTVGLDKEWLVTSPYFEKVNKDLVIVCTTAHSASHFDYATLSNAWYVTQFQSTEELEWYCSFMNRGFRLWGIRGDNLTENGVVTTVAKYSGTYFYSWGLANVSVLSGFRLENAQGKSATLTRETTVTDYSKTEVKNKHTVCMMVSDGDNMQSTTDKVLSNSYLFASDTRTTDVPITYGMSGLLIKLIPVVLLSYYDKLYPSESLVMQIASIGYTYPSKWNDDAAFDEVIKALDEAMQIADIHVVEIMDDTSFLNIIDIPCLFDRYQKYFDKYTALEQVNGGLFITYQSCYDGFNGEVCWSNDKPIVSARYSIWNTQKNDAGTGTDQNSLDYIASQINNASTDVTSEEAYSFIIVHIGTGLDDEGNLVSSGDTMAAMTRLAEMFDDDVEVVNADEFIARMSYYVER